MGGIELPAHAAQRHAPGSAVDLFIRPEHVRLESMNGHVPAGAVAADVRETTFLGSLTRLRLTVLGLEAHGGITADLPSEQAEHFRTGDRVLARWDAGAPKVMARN